MITPSIYISSGVYIGSSVFFPVFEVSPEKSVILFLLSHTAKHFDSCRLLLIRFCNSKHRFFHCQISRYFQRGNKIFFPLSHLFHNKNLPGAHYKCTPERSCLFSDILFKKHHGKPEYRISAQIILHLLFLYDLTYYHAMAFQARMHSVRMSARFAMWICTVLTDITGFR